MRKFYLNNGSDNKKNNLIFMLFCLMILSVLSISFSYFQVNGNSVVINSVVDAPMELLVYVDGEEASGFPTRSAGYIYDSITCKNGSSGVWNNDTWSLDMNFKKGDACIIYFIKAYQEEILAGSDPVLDSKMVPVNITDDGIVTVADTTKEWYSYENSEWANVVIVDPTFTTLDPGTTIPMESIEQMYVWIPRYEYKKSSIVNASESIEINFVSISTVNTDIENNDVIVHPAFTFGGVEQAGLWIGKFELGFNDGESESTANVEYIIKPNVNSVHNTNVSTLFDKINNAMTTYSMDATTDVHMMKNTEWGAVAYLSQSQYGICEDDVTCSVKIENNNYYNNNSAWDIVTGCGGDDTAVTNNVTGIEICPTSNRWETKSGIKSTTTHNITGIYDMAGGRNEYVMGNMQDSSGNFYSLSAAFITAPDSKYYDSYEYGSSSSDYTRGIYGDAIVELNPSGYNMSNWNSDYAYFAYSSNSWFLRGGLSYYGSNAGVWHFFRNYGDAYDSVSARSVVSFVQ